MGIEELRKLWADAIATMEALVKKGKDEKRTLTEDEGKEYDALSEKCKGYEKDIQRSRS